MTKSITINSCFIMILLFFCQCNQEKNPYKKIHFSSVPSFHKGFDFELDCTKKELTFIVDNTWMYRTNESEQNTFYELDSLTQEVIKKYGQHEFKITKTLSEWDFNKLNKALNYIIQSDELDTNEGLDGIGYFIKLITKDSIQSFIYHTPSPNPKKIKTIIDIVDKNFGENVVARFSIENVRRYTTLYKYYKILSKDPLYIRLYEDIYCHPQVDKIIKKLPDADTVYLDFTNYDVPLDSCVFQYFKPKYKIVKTITPPRIWLYNRYIFEYRSEMLY